MVLLDEGQTTCCYARSDKYWVTDPQGIAWEHFRILDSIPVFRERTAETAEASTCGAPRTQRGRPLPTHVKSNGYC